MPGWASSASYSGWVAELNAVARYQSDDKPPKGSGFSSVHSVYVLVWWLVNRARYGEVAGTSLAYRTVSDQKVNSTQGSGEDSATTLQITRIWA